MHMSAHSQILTTRESVTPPTYFITLYYTDTLHNLWSYWVPLVSATNCVLLLNIWTSVCRAVLNLSPQPQTTFLNCCCWRFNLCIVQLFVIYTTVSILLNTQYSGPSYCLKLQHIFMVDLAEILPHSVAELGTANFLISNFSKCAFREILDVKQRALELTTVKMIFDT